MATEPRPIVCTLTPAAATDQLGQWADLIPKATSIESLPDGAQLRFPAALEPEVADLASREGQCCAFLDIGLTLADGEVVLDVTSDNPQALPVIAGIVGVP